MWFAWALPENTTSYFSVLAVSLKKMFSGLFLFLFFKKNSLSCFCSVSFFSFPFLPPFFSLLQVKWKVAAEHLTAGLQKLWAGSWLFLHLGAQTPKWGKRGWCMIPRKCPCMWNSLCACPGQHGSGEGPCTKDTIEFLGCQPEEAGSKMYGGRQQNVWINIQIIPFSSPLPIPLLLEKKASVAWSQKTHTKPLKCLSLISKHHPQKLKCGYSHD